MGSSPRRVASRMGTEPTLRRAPNMRTPHTCRVVGHHGATGHSRHTATIHACSGALASTGCGTFPSARHPRCVDCDVTRVGRLPHSSRLQRVCRALPRAAEHHRMSGPWPVPALCPLLAASNRAVRVRSALPPAGDDRRPGMQRRIGARTVARLGLLILATLGTNRSWHSARL
jgi:hypothetical protein